MRKLASIRRIADILPIAGGDAIEGAVVDGWKVVIKKGELAEGVNTSRIELLEELIQNHLN
jgi:hypothetical protein